MDKVLTHKNVILVLIAISLTYLIYTLLVGSDLNWLHFLLLINLIGLSFTLKNVKHTDHNIIEDPIAFVSFDGPLMWIGNTAININEIRKLTLDTAGNDGFFSLPYNQISSGKTPSFTFPACQFEAFRAHLREGLPKAQFITEGLILKSHS
jgi:hypothetical protein